MLIRFAVFSLLSLYFDLLYFTYFPLLFLGRDFGSDCISSWSLLMVYFLFQTLFLFANSKSKVADQHAHPFDRYNVLNTSM